RKQGQPYVDKRPKMKAKIKKVSYLFEKHPNALLMIYRYLFGFRIVVPIMIGLTDYSLARFVFLSIVGGIVWVCLFGFLGYHCADQILRNLSFIQENIWAFLLLLTIFGIARHWYKRRKDLSQEKWVEGS
ncbi:MAG: VTT domain-containing protein, partial [Bacteroidota bacterium]